MPNPKALAEVSTSWKVSNDDANLMGAVPSDACPAFVHPQGSLRLPPRVPHSTMA